MHHLFGSKITQIPGSQRCRWVVYTSNNLVFERGEARHREQAETLVAQANQKLGRVTAYEWFGGCPKGPLPKTGVSSGNQRAAKFNPEPGDSNTTTRISRLLEAIRNEPS